jgi:CRP-like cAMP-binding protein
VLLQLAQRYGQQVPQGVLLDLHLSQADLASFINAGEKSVHRVLAELRDHGLVLTGGQRQLLVHDIDGLTAVAEGSPWPT